MKIDKTPHPGPCDVVEAMFVFGPQRCMKWTDFTTVDGDETFYICEDHIAASRAEAQS
jgi:hypothetical protein